MCQWLPVADLTPEDFKSVVATFAKVYRHTMLWHSTSAVLIGSDEPFETTVEELATRLAQPRVKGQLEPLGIADPFAFLGELQLDDAQVREFAGDALINTDDNLHLEFSSPLAVGGDRSVWTVLEEMHGFPPGESPLPEGDSNASRVAAVQRAKTLTAFGTIGLRSPEPEKQLRAVREMNTIVAKFPNYRPAAMVLSEFLAHRSAYLLEAGRAPFALADAERAIRLDPGSGAAHRALATVRRSLKQLTEAIGSFEKATALEPRNWRNHLGLAETLLELGRVEDARVAVVAGLEVHPFNDELRALMGEPDES
jgi:tetratricopeptide (TPR) repeat protein